MRVRSCAVNAEPEISLGMREKLGQMAVVNGEAAGWKTPTATVMSGESVSNWNGQTCRSDGGSLRRLTLKRHRPADSNRGRDKPRLARLAA